MSETDNFNIDPSVVQDDESNEEIVDGQINKEVRNGLIEIVGDYLRKPSRKIRVFLAVTAFLLGLGSQTSRILEAYYQFLLTNPACVRYDDKETNRPFAAAQPILGDRVIPEPFTKDQESDSVYLNLGDTRLELRPNFFGIDKSLYCDQNSKLKIEDPVIANLTSDCLEYVVKPEDEARFRMFLRKELANKFKDSEYTERWFQKGDVVEFIQVACGIVEDNMKYDEMVGNAIETDSTGKMKYKIGPNPIKSLIDMSHDNRYDGMPVDRLLIDEKTGVCRHFADSLTLVAEEIKKMYPDKFQNTYIVPYSSAYQNHRYNMAVLIRNPKEVTFFALEPQNKQLQNPSFEVIKTMYNRNLVSKEQYYKLINDLLSVSGIIEKNADLFAIITDAKYDGRPDIAKLAKEVALAQTGYETLCQMLAEKNITEDEFASAILKILSHNSCLSYGNFQIDKLIEKSHQLKAENQKLIFDSLRGHFADNMKHKEPTWNYIQTVFLLHDRQIYNDREFVKVCERFYVDYENSQLDRYLDYLLSNPETVHLAEKQLARQIENIFESLFYFFQEENGSRNFMDKSRLISYALEQKNRLYDDHHRHFVKINALTGKDMLSTFNTGINQFINKVTAKRKE